jgi:hypothetical protein
LEKERKNRNKRWRRRNGEKERRKKMNRTVIKSNRRFLTDTLGLRQFRL